MTANQSDISVIVCAYTEDRWSDMVAAIDSLRRQMIKPHQIILVVDHNPTLYARSHNEFTDITVIENHEPRGLSGARNSALTLVTGSIIAFMDEDAIAAPDWLLRLALHYHDPLIFGVGGAIEPLWANGRPAWFPSEFDWVVGCTYHGMPEHAAPVRNLIGCNMSFRKEVFQLVGGFRNGIGRIGTYPVGCEETELCIRLRQRRPDIQLIFEPQARVQHRVPTTRANWDYFRRRCYAEGLSKSLVSRLVGAKDGLSNERTYTTRTLPLAMLKALATGKVVRAAAIPAGVLITLVGYFKGARSAHELPVAGVMAPVAAHE